MLVWVVNVIQANPLILARRLFSKVTQQTNSRAQEYQKLMCCYDTLSYASHQKPILQATNTMQWNAQVQVIRLFLSILGFIPRPDFNTRQQEKDRFPKIGHNLWTTPRLFSRSFRTYCNARFASMYAFSIRFELAKMFASIAFFFWMSSFILCNRSV